MFFLFDSSERFNKYYKKNSRKIYGVLSILYINILYTVKYLKDIANVKME